MIWFDAHESSCDADKKVLEARPFADIMLGVPLPDPENSLDGVQLRAVPGLEDDAVPGPVDNSTHVVVDSAVVHPEEARTSRSVVLLDERSEVCIESLGRVGRRCEVAVTDTVSIDRGDGCQSDATFGLGDKAPTPRFAQP